MMEPNLKKDQPWRVDLHQGKRHLSVLQGVDRLWYIFHRNLDYGGLGVSSLAYTGGGFDEQADAVDEAMNYLKIFGLPVIVS